MLAAIWLAVGPSDHIRFSCSTRSSVQGILSFAVALTGSSLTRNPSSFAGITPVAKPIHMTENATSRSLLQGGYKIAETHRNNRRRSIPAFPQIAAFSQKLLKG